MAKQVLNVGAKNNDKTGDTLRAGGLKIKANFEEIYSALATDGLNISGGDVLKTGSYSDLRNKPSFSPVATTGNFYDLGNRPDIGIFIGEPPNAEGVDGHVTGNMAFSSNYLYVCTADYIQQDQYSDIVWLHDEDSVDFSLPAFATSNDGYISLERDITLPAPEPDWFVTDGTVTRTITQVSLEQDETTQQQYYLLQLDGQFNATAGTYYEVGRLAAPGTHVFCGRWKPEYQALVDAHDQGQGSHIYVTYDGYGRNVVQILHDSIENEITIVYEAGSKISNYNGMVLKLDQPKIWKRVSWDTNW